MYTVRNGAYTPAGSTLNNGKLCGVARARARSTLDDCILTVLADEETRVAYVTKLEACAAAYCAHDYGTYMSIMSKLVFNLSRNGEHVIKTYPVSQICRLTHKRLRADTEHTQKDTQINKRLAALMTRAETEAAKATALASSVQNATLVKCPKCKSTENITRVLAQLRSGDEGMSTRCLCRKCGSTWKLAS
jgi:DNA-directed RNA polymerase subunit M/transcription elongation factor TFIIS